MTLTKSELLILIESETDFQKKFDMATEFLKPDHRYPLDRQKEKEAEEKYRRKNLARHWVGRHCLSWPCNFEPYMYKRHGHEPGFKIKQIGVSREKLIRSLVHYEPFCRQHWPNWNKTMGILSQRYPVVYEWVAADERLRYEIPDSEMQFRIAEIRDEPFLGELWMIPTPEWPHRLHSINRLPLPYPGHPADPCKCTPGHLPEISCPVHSKI